MPLYYVQITPWQAEGKDKLDRAWFRQCQLELMYEVPNVGMVTTTDAGSEKLFILLIKSRSVSGWHIGRWQKPMAKRFPICRAFL
ncbi:hypothetical protein NXU94_24240 [Bacteroides faecis]|nr:hypothetical protein [Bacteroides faecis]